MNILINTPLLNSSHLKENFDNKILAIFLILIAVLVMVGVLFVDFSNAFGSSDPVSSSEQNQQNAPRQMSLYG